jgi:sugar O-acyltransferase (sialic acid O-acetyltransferase NeuD family)
LSQAVHDQDCPVIVFGVGQIADVARIYLEQAGIAVAGFTVDAGFSAETVHAGLPVHVWDALEHSAPPSSVRLFCPISYRRVNLIRRDRFQEGKARGYNFASFVHPNCVNNAASIGENCFILENNVLQPFTRIGDNTILWSGNHIGHHSTIGAHCFLTSQVVVSGGVAMGERCFVGVNATIGDNIVLGEAVVIGAGALVLRDLPAESVVAERSSEISPIPSSRLRSFQS